MAFDDNDKKYMEAALALAKEAFDDGEVPVGAVAVRDGKIVGTGRNRREKGKNALCHAEIEAINEACSALGGWRLPETTLYVTLEPCPMCAGAIINARIGRVVFAAKDPRMGALGSVVDLDNYPLGHKVTKEYGLYEKEALKLLSDFFAELRKKREDLKIIPAPRPPKARSRSSIC